MILIGMLHHRKDPTKVKKSYAYAIVAKAEGAEFIYFSPKGVDFQKRKIYGYQYYDGTWNKVISDFPNVIYNAGSPEKLNKSIEVIRKLNKEIPFTTSSIGNKLSVYNRLKDDAEFSRHLIPSHVLKHVNQFFDYLELYHDVVVKPFNGHKGQGIIHLKQEGKNYHLETKVEDKIMSKEELRNYGNKIINKTTYIIQPYIKSLTKNGLAVDFRLHTQKNGEGKWVITAIYPRIAPKGSIVTNINNGGTTLYLEPFLKQEYGNEYRQMKWNLEEFSMRLSKRMDELQKYHFNERIDELGIDVGLDERNNIWIYEVNWRPGCPPAFYLELDVVKNMIHYAQFLAR